MAQFYWSSTFPTQGKGAHNPLIKGLQTYLTYENVVSPGTVDGIFGSNTKSSVMSYQGLHNCTVDGIVGPQTWGRMHGNLVDYRDDYPIDYVYKSPGSESSPADFFLTNYGAWGAILPNGSGVIIYDP